MYFKFRNWHYKSIVLITEINAFITGTIIIMQKMEDNL